MLVFSISCPVLPMPWMVSQIEGINYYKLKKRIVQLNFFT